MTKQTKIAAYTLDWLTTPADDFPSDVIDVERMPYAIPPELGNAWVDSLSLRDGVVLFRAVHEMEPSPAGQWVHLMNARLAPIEPIFGAQIWLSGLGCHREYWNGPDQPSIDIVAGPGRDTFRYHKDFSCNILVEGGVTSEMRSVIIPNEALTALLGEDAAQSLLDRLGLGGKRPTVVRPVSAHVSTPLREALSGHVSGTARKLYAQARVLDYLVALLAHLSSDKEIRKEHGHRTRVRELHGFLLHLEGRLPTLGELAKQFGLPAKRLNEGFIAEYGMSVYNFVTEYRLKQAHASILASTTPLKTIATRLGYSHVNHFIVAFRRKFGYSPGSLRKTKREN